MNAERKAYETRVKLPRWNHATSLGFCTVDDTARRRIMRQTMGHLPPSVCLARAEWHARRMETADAGYMRAVRTAFGRGVDSSRDYAVSCVWRADFSAEHKARMRRWNAAKNYHEDMALAYRAASKYQRAA